MIDFDSRKVLIVDDSAMYRTSAVKMLNKLGLKPQQAVMVADAAQAISACRVNEFQLVLIDYNLGLKANGCQLLDDLKDQELLAPDCAVVIITGDASEEVVRSFSELEPDCYLVKPLNFNSLKSRIPKLLSQKRALSKILWSIKNGDFDNGLDACESVMVDVEDLSHKAVLLKVEILMRQGEMEMARNLLISLNGSISTDTFSAKLAEIAIAQRQYSMAEYILLTHLKNAPDSPKELNLLSELFFKNGKTSQAKEMVEKSISISPTVIDRHWLHLCCSLVEKSADHALKAVNQIISLSKFSLRRNIEAYQLGASIIADSIIENSIDNREAVVKRLKPFVTNWRNEFQVDDYRSFEQIIMARAYFALGLRSKATNLIEKFSKDLSISAASPLVLMELAKLAHQVDGKWDKAEVSKKFDEKISELSESHYKYIGDALKRHMAIWKNQYSEQKTKYIEWHHKSVSAYEDGRFDEAAQHLIDMFYSNVQITMETPRRLLKTLSKGWPQGMGRNQVLKLAIKCKDSLIKEQTFPTSTEEKMLQMLSVQLNYPDLKYRASARQG
jgi:DNA-binding response OmpR family regulator